MNFVNAETSGASIDCINIKGDYLVKHYEKNFIIKKIEYDLYLHFIVGELGFSYEKNWLVDTKGSLDTKNLFVNKTDAYTTFAISDTLDCNYYSEKCFYTIGSLKNFLKFVKINLVTASTQNAVNALNCAIERTEEFENRTREILKRSYLQKSY